MELSKDCSIILIIIAVFLSILQMDEKRDIFSIALLKFKERLRR